MRCDGVLPLCWSMHHAGPLTKDIRDTVLVLNAVAGDEAKDPTMASVPVPDYLIDVIEPAWHAESYRFSPGA